LTPILYILGLEVPKYLQLNGSLDGCVPSVLHCPIAFVWLGKEQSLRMDSLQI
jgi:hypothetical protein